MRFTLRRDPRWRLSACADGPSGRDVDSRVHVRVSRVSAGDAAEHRLVLAVLRGAVLADAAGLGRECGVDSLEPSCRLLLKTSRQCSPAITQDAAVQTGFGAAAVRQEATRSLWVGSGPGAPAHLSNPQVLDAYDVESSREIGAGLLDPVPAAIASSSEQPGNRDCYSLAAVGAGAASSQPLLQVPQPGLFGRRQSRAREKLSCGEGRRHADAAVDADDLSRAGRSNRFWDDSERQMPASGPITSDPVRLRVGYGAGQPELHPADLRNEYPRPLPIQLDDPGSLRADNAETLVLPSLTPRRATVRARVEVLDCLVEVSQRLLLHSLRSGAQPIERCPRFSELPCLLDVGRRRLFVAGPHRPLLQRQVPHRPRVSTLFQQRGLLLLRRIHPEPGHADDPIMCHRQSLILEGRQPRILPAEASGSSGQAK